jgi:putative inorganic carbon (HCO3(-)) transporter
VPPLAALTGPMPKAGVVILAALVGSALLSRSARGRAVAMLGVLALAPTLLLIDIWHSPQLHVVHRHPLLAIAAGAAALALLSAAAVLIHSRPALLGALIVVALPFRIPIQAGGITSNLLVPLYLVVAAGSLAVAVPALRPEAERERAANSGWIERLLALYVLLYAVQAIYSDDFEKALQQMVFFYAPFAVMFCLLRELRWTDRLIRRSVELVAGLAILFAVVGFVEYATKTIILNPKLVVQNDLHAYFTVNSVFFDPDIFGRFLALVMILLASALLYARRRRDQLVITVVLGVLWAGLVLTLSRSSLGALLVGLGTLGALRWRLSRTLLLAGLVVAVGIAAVAVSPRTFGLNQGLNGASSGRAGLIGGGIRMFRERPVWGYGSGSFVVRYRKEHPSNATGLAASHAIPVTIAAEQGVIGELAYVALVLAAATALAPGAVTSGARAAILAAFLALIFHTLLYADFLEDPVTWTLLGVGAALARSSRPEPPAEAPQELEAVAA